MSKRFFPEDDGWQYHHMVSWIVGRQPLLGDEEKDYFQRLLRSYAAFYGARLVTYCVMDNHFHLLLGVNPAEAREFAESASDEEVLARSDELAPFITTLQAQRMSEARERGDDKTADVIKAKILSRIGDLSAFGRDLKVQTSRWFNRRTGRGGTLWESRFHGVLVEDDRLALETVAAYIDLNPVRAGVVLDPAEYPFCGYGEAQGNSKRARAARAGIALAVGMGREAAAGETGWWKMVSRRYRDVLFGPGASSLQVDPEELRAALKSRTLLSRPQALRCHVRHFVDGAVIGRQDFVERIVLDEKKKGWFNENRVQKSRPLPAADWCGLRALRGLTNPISIPDSLQGP